MRNASDDARGQQVAGSRSLPRGNANSGDDGARRSYLRAEDGLAVARDQLTRNEETLKLMAEEVEAVKRCIGQKRVTFCVCGVNLRIDWWLYQLGSQLCRRAHVLSYRAPFSSAVECMRFSQSRIAWCDVIRFLFPRIWYMYRANSLCQIFHYPVARLLGHTPHHVDAGVMLRVQY